MEKHQRGMIEFADSRKDQWAKRRIRRFTVKTCQTPSQKGRGTRRESEKHLLETFFPKGTSGNLDHASKNIAIGDSYGSEGETEIPGYGSRKKGKESLGGI